MSACYKQIDRHTGMIVNMNSVNLLITAPCIGRAEFMFYYGRGGGCCHGWWVSVDFRGREIVNLSFSLNLAAFSIGMTSQIYA